MDSAWKYVQDRDVELMGPDVRDPEAQARWSLAFAIAGGLPFIWNELARPITEIIYALLEVKAGDRVLVIGEAVDSVGWGQELRQIVGDSGVVDIVEIIEDGRRAVSTGLRGRNGMLGCWQWTYTHGIEDASYDCVAVLQSTQHCDDWREMGQELARVTKHGRRVVFAEAVYGGPHFLERISADVHIRQWVNKALETLINLGEVSSYTGEELKEMMDPYFEGTQCLEWRGIEMFWGRKPGLAG